MNRHKNVRVALGTSLSSIKRQPNKEVLLALNDAASVFKMLLPPNERIVCDGRSPFEKFVDWQQCASVMQREAVTVVSSCSGGGNVVVA
jgi:hypothetical protein